MAQLGDYIEVSKEGVPSGVGVAGVPLDVETILKIPIYCFQWNLAPTAQRHYRNSKV